MNETTQALIIDESGDLGAEELVELAQELDEHANLSRETNGISYSMFRDLAFQTRKEARSTPIEQP